MVLFLIFSLHFAWFKFETKTVDGTGNDGTKILKLEQN